MKNRKILILIKCILTLMVIAIAFSYRTSIGIALAAICLAYLLFSIRAGIFRFIGSIQYSKKDFEKAVIWFKRAYENGKSKPRSAIQYAYLLLKSGNIDESERIFKSLIDSQLQTDDLMFARSNLALVLWKKGDLDGAVNMLEDIFSSFKTSTIYGSLGYLLILEGDMQKALKFNLEAYEYNSKNPVILDNLGQTYYLAGDYEKAVEIYKKLMSLNPTFPEAYFNYGLVLVKKGEAKDALLNMQKALNYKLSFLSTITREEIESKIEETGKMLD